MTKKIKGVSKRFLKVKIINIKCVICKLYV